MCHNWFVARSEIYPSVVYMACGGDDFHLKISKIRIFFYFVLFH